MNELTYTGRLKPTTVTFKWEINNFGSSRRNVGDYFRSPKFLTCCSNMNYTWSLKLYPKGERVEYGDYISLFVKYYGEIEVNSTIILSILDNKNNKFESKTLLSKLFQNEKSWGYMKFINRRYLMNESTDILNNDVLTILCEIIHDSQIPTLISKNTEDHVSHESENEPNYRKELDDFEKLLVTEHLSDVTFIIGRNKLHLHKAILSSRSPVFYAMFEHEMKEKQENQVVITDIKYEVMKEVSRFIYASRVNEMQKYACDLLVAAEKYSISGLKELCEISLYNNLTVSNALEYLTLAGACNSILLKLQVIEFIASFQHIVNSPEFKFLDPDLMCEVTRAIVEKNLEQ